MDFSITKAFTVESLIREFLISTYGSSTEMVNYFLLTQNFSSETDSKEQARVE